MYNICVLAYPTDSGFEETLNEFLINGDIEPEDNLYCGFVQGIEMDNITEDLENYLKNGFKEVIVNG